jgi:alpha-beta hydrolase superfamily lysophospholipase
VESAARTFRCSDGVELFYRTFAPDEGEKAHIIIVHGHGENTDRWIDVSRHFAERGFRISVYDQRGHGRSPGQRGYINDWSELREDLRSFVRLSREQYPELPVFLYSMSMGGLVTLDFCLHYPEDVDGAICTAPAIGKIGLSPPLFFLARILDRIWPRFSFQNPISAEYLSRDKEWVSFVLSDPLSHGTGTPRLLMQIQKTAAWVHENVSRWRTPLLLMHGSADAYASVEGSRQFTRNITYSDIKYIEYEGGYHDLSNDSIKTQVFSDVEDWLDAHI